MPHPDALPEHLRVLEGQRLDGLNLACEMMMFSFGEYELHAQCLTRILMGSDILATTQDYQSWDGECDKNNDEWHFVKQYKDNIVGGCVMSVSVSGSNDVIICLDNGIRIELYIANGYCHYGEEQEQWVFFKRHDYAHPFVTVYNKSVDISCNGNPDC